MITLVQKAVRYAVGSSSSNDQLDELLSCRPKLQDFVSTSHSAPETKEFEGLVTSTDCSCIVVDQDVYCEPSDFPPDSKVRVGIKVRGSAQRGGQHEMWRARMVEVVQEEWDAGPGAHCTKTHRGHNMKPSKGYGEAISCRDLAEGIPGIFKSDLLSSVPSRSDQPGQPGVRSEASQALAKTEATEAIIGRVTGIYDNTVTLNNSICCSLATASCPLDLVTGDWIVCDVLDSSCSIDEGGDGGSWARQVQDIKQVSSVKPLRRKRVRGEVTHSYPTHCIVNEEIFCSRAIAGASVAKIGDVMAVEVIESQQDRLCWRAISVSAAAAAAAPSTQDPRMLPSLVPLSCPLPKIDLGKNRVQNILEDNGNIVIPKTISFPPVTLGCAAFTCVSIRNTGPRPATLRRVYFVCASQESQFSLAPCSNGGVADGMASPLAPGAEAVVRLCCAGTLIGRLRQLCIFDFETFHIGRHVSAVVEDPFMVSLAPVSCYTPSPRHCPSAMPRETGIILGQRAFRPSPFIPVKLPSVRVPERLWHEVNRGDLFNVSAVLREPLNADNHKKKFSLLLHIEEIKMTQQMREFDMARANFMVCGEFLSLTVPGLAERRPSLMIGDTVVATDLCDGGGSSTEYEGCIHQVLHTQILLKFHPTFHNDYHGEDYKVRFNFNRTPLRRCHFALSHSMRQLGPDVLFPFRLRLQLPQVCYIDPEVQALTRQWKHCPSGSQLMPAVAGGTSQDMAPEYDGQSSPTLKLPVVTRLFGVPLQETNSQSYCSEGNSQRQESGFVSTDRVASVSEHVHGRKEAQQPLSQFRSHQQEHSNTPKATEPWPRQKAYQGGGAGTKLIPRSLDLAMLRSANRTKTSDNEDGDLEKPVPSETQQNEGYMDSRVKLSQKVGCSNGPGTALKTRPCYVMPVLPLGYSRKKTQDLAKLPILRWSNKSLNREQKLAVRRILEGTTRPQPYVIFGPPGTGKTVTLVEAALQIWSLVPHSRLLVVTPSNSASDLVAERMVESGWLGMSDLVRLIAYQRVKESIPEVILPYCYHGEEVEVRAHQRIVVATATCSGVLYTHGLHQEHFTHVLVDEAGQLTEPECLVPLGLVNRVTGQIVLAGDPRQLGPVVQSGLAKQGGLQNSLLQRLCQSVLYQAEGRSECSGWEYEPSLVTKLVKNYRSHQHILAVPSRLFYGSTLQACASVEGQEHLLAWEELPCKSCPLLFHGVVGTNLQEGDSPSWFNPAEAFQVVRYTKSLLLHGVEERNIGIITPYRKQTEKLHKLLNTFSIEGVKVGSVEEFQGQERKVILISTVRSSSSGTEEDAKYSLGFVKCCKRFNVAVTRAQGLLIIVGNPLLLYIDDSWKELLKYCIEKGAYRGPELEDI